jgi:hypothetical protein
MKRLHLALAAAAAVALAALTLAAPARAGGMWEVLPPVGSSVCVNNVNGTCVSTVTGPTSLTGNETVPADTNLSQGQNPQSIRIPMTSLGGGNIQVVTTNASVTTAAGTRYLISNQSTATIASVALPPNPTDNQVFTIVNAGSGVLTLTAITVGASPSGTTIAQGAAPASLAVQTNNSAAASLSAVDYVYRAADNKWYRVQ